ncbi:MAG: hypothetical protein QF465_10115, partial [SAR202 cluster bacterium]|nr:hypothetical protein [SAR202 cluster bacterium]
QGQHCRSSSASDGTADPPELQVGASDVITLTYTDASPSAVASETLQLGTARLVPGVTTVALILLGMVFVVLYFAKAGRSPERS